MGEGRAVFSAHFSPKRGEKEGSPRLVSHIKQGVNQEGTVFAELSLTDQRGAVCAELSRFSQRLPTGGELYATQCSLFLRLKGELYAPHCTLTSGYTQGGAHTAVYTQGGAYTAVYTRVVYLGLLPTGVYFRVYTTVYHRVYIGCIPWVYHRVYIGGIYWYTLVVCLPTTLVGVYLPVHMPPYYSRVHPASSRPSVLHGYISVCGTVSDDEALGST